MSIPNVLPNEPIATSRRVAWLDALRGLALLGVLLANTQHFAGTGWVADAGRSSHTPRLDRALGFMVDAAIDGKFYSLFALLFGVGCALQWERWQNLTAQHQKRMLALGGIGALHLCLLWFGDILLLYALIGLLLPRFRHTAPRKLLSISAVLLALPVLLHALFLALLPARVGGPDPKALRFAFEQAVAAGSYWSRVRWNLLHGFAQRGRDLFATGRPFKVLAMCLLGVYTHRTGLLSDTASALLRLRRVARLGFFVGVPLNLALAVMMRGSAYERLLPRGIWQPIFYAFGVPALALAYAASFRLGFLSPTFAARALGLLRSVGQMSLTSYVTQSIAGVCLYDHWGGDLFGRVGTALSLGLALAIFTAQIALSRWWAAHYGRGPLERVWRALTYPWAPQPQLVATSTLAGDE